MPPRTVPEEPNSQPSDGGLPAAPGGDAEVAVATEQEEAVVHILWCTGGLSCDGDSVALTAATQPSIEEIALGALPGLPRVAGYPPPPRLPGGPPRRAGAPL